MESEPDSGLGSEMPQTLAEAFRVGEDDMLYPRRLIFYFLCVPTFVIAFTCVVARSNPPKKATASLPPAATRTIDFALDVQPLLVGRCVRCHGPKKAEGGLRLDRKSDALAGGNSGRAFEPGKSAASRLIRYVAGL